jgi:hypothetical protein
MKTQSIQQGGSDYLVRRSAVSVRKSWGEAISGREGQNIWWRGADYPVKKS